MLAWILSSSVLILAVITLRHILKGKIRLGQAQRLVYGRILIGVILAAGIALAFTFSGTACTDTVDSGAGVIVAFADINRDGLAEMLYLDKSRMDSGSIVTLRIYDSDGHEIWHEDAGTPHAGWNSLFLCHLAGKDYLLRYNPGMWQGRGSYTYTLFTLEGGAEKVYQTATLEFDINGAGPLDPEGMVAFADQVNALLESSTLLLSSEGGVFAFGPASTKPFLETYSWLDGNSALFAQGDDLATRLQKYSDYAMANRAGTN